MSDADFTPEKQKEYIDKLILSYVKGGKDINEVLNMPFHFFLELLSVKNEHKPKQTKSLIAAFSI